MCKPEESMDWYEKMWKNTVDFFRTLDIPVRTLECCSGDLADLKVKSCDVEAWSPRQKKYFEVGSCSNLGDAQARRLGIRHQGRGRKKYLTHTLNKHCCGATKNVDRISGKQPPGRRLCEDSGNASAIHGWHEEIK